MSWNINVVGKPADVKAVVQAELYVPQPIKDLVALFCDTYSSKPESLVQVTSYGHYDPTYGGNVGQFSLEEVKLVIAPPFPPAG